LALQEYTPDFEEELAATGLLDQFSHQVGTADTDASGTMLLSRTPVELVAEAEGTVFENLIATTTVEGTDWHLGVIHTAPPQMGADVWARDGAAIEDLAAPYLDQNLLLVGDFNAIDQHRGWRSARPRGEATGRRPGVASHLACGHVDPVVRAHRSRAGLRWCARRGVAVRDGRRQRSQGAAGRGRRPRGVAASVRVR
ncbi:MAG: endonuclease/exonuclease/phosphatase family protein, partial [Brachybacterium sp.]|nr:endonuclease/exonuclease/phosphatase family protein [Brachybacterium sp.]